MLNDAFDYGRMAEFVESPLNERNNIICPPYPGALGEEIDFSFVHDATDSWSGDVRGFPVHRFGVPDTYGSTGMLPGMWSFTWEATNIPHQDPFSAFYGAIHIEALHIDHVIMQNEFDNAGARFGTGWYPRDHGALPSHDYGPIDTPDSGQFYVPVRDWCLWRLYLGLDTQLQITFHIHGVRLN